MAAEWYYSRGGEQHGPVSGKELKELAASGEVLPSDSVWKQGMDEWQPAAQVKGLLPQGRSVSAPPVLPHRRQAEAFRVASDTAAQVSQKLWFLDLKFEQFATLKLIRFVFAASLAGQVLFAVAVAAYVLLNYPALQAVFIVLFDLILLALFAISFRVFLEFILIGFRISEHLWYLRYLQKDESTDLHTK